jgi:NTE family protein
MNSYIIILFTKLLINYFLLLSNKNVTSFPVYNVLSFSGGGSFGAVEIGILSKIHNLEPKKYDLYTGISVGGLNAGFLSHFEYLENGIDEVKNIYKNIRTKDIYEIRQRPELGLLNTIPLQNTITNFLKKMDKPCKETLIGTTNLYTGKMDKYYYNKLPFDDRILLLMSTTAIPILFPPVKFNNNLYVDGGVIANEIVSDISSLNYINITFITPFSNLLPKYNLRTYSDIINRNVEIVKKTYNNQISKLNTQCDIPRGEINMYYIDSVLLNNYSFMNFDNGKELFDLGYNNVKVDKYNLCY